MSLKLNWIIFRTTLISRENQISVFSPLSVLFFLAREIYRPIEAFPSAFLPISANLWVCEWSDRNPLKTKTSYTICEMRYFLLNRGRVNHTQNVGKKDLTNQWRTDCTYSETDYSPTTDKDKNYAWLSCNLRIFWLFFCFALIDSHDSLRNDLLAERGEEKKVRKNVGFRVWVNSLETIRTKTCFIMSG